MIRFAVASDGYVVRATVLSNELAQEIGCCVQNAVRSWSFPWTQAFTIVEYPFVFKLAFEPPS